MKKIIVLGLAVLLLPACLGLNDKYAKVAQNEFKIKHMYSRPTTAYGPGTVVLNEKETGYTWVCEPRWILNGIDYKIVTDVIADQEVSKATNMEFDVKIKSDYGTIEEQYKQISKIVLSFKNGQQEELHCNLKKLKENINKPGDCRDNCLDRLKTYPKAEIDLVQVVYGYDLDVIVKDSKGNVLNLELPDTLLKYLTAQVGFVIQEENELHTKGTHLYVGFNGDALSIPGEKSVYIINNEKVAPIVNITDDIK